MVCLTHLVYQPLCLRKLFITLYIRGHCKIALITYTRTHILILRLLFLFGFLQISWYSFVSLKPFKCILPIVLVSGFSLGGFININSSFVGILFTLITCSLSRCSFSSFYRPASMASVWLLSIISISKIVKVILWQVLVIGRCR